MNRTITAILALAFTVFSPVPAAITAADNTSPQKLGELYNNTVFPLWGSREAAEPLCAISYLSTERLDIFNEEVERSYLVSAGHCGGGAIRRSESSEYIISILGTRLTGTHDELIASIFDWRSRVTYFGPPRPPRLDEVAYAAKTLMRSDGKTKLQQLKFIGQDKVSKAFVFRGEMPVIKGMSGSPVVSADGELLGIIVRIHPADDYLYEVIPAETVMKTLSFVRE